MSLVNVLFWVFCLQGYHALGYCASLSVVHPCASSALDVLPLGVTARALILLGCCASRGHTSLDIVPLDLLRQHISGY